MLDIKYILANQSEYAEILKNRKHDFDLSKLVTLDERRRKIIGETEDLKAKRNEGSKKIGMAKKNPEIDVEEWAIQSNPLILNLRRSKQSYTLT